MHISSIVVKTSPKATSETVDLLCKSELCEVHLYREGNIIITLNGSNTNEIITKTKKIERFKNVLSVQIAFSYYDDETQEDISKIEKQDEVAKWLNDDDIEAEKIKYSGDIRNF